MHSKRDSRPLYGIIEVSAPFQPVPEPAEYAALAGLGLAIFAGYRRWKRS